jgi:diguanylate cyclase (GGDEF)-like protein
MDSSVDPRENPPDAAAAAPTPRIRNRGACVSASALAGASALAVYAFLAQEGAARAAFGPLHALQTLFWLGSLSVFLFRPSYNRRSPYARFSGIAGGALLGISLAYGAAAVWTGAGFPIWAAFSVAGLSLARLPRGFRGAFALLAGTALSLLSFYLRGAEAPRADLVNILAPLALGQAAGLFVDRIRTEAELSLKDLKSQNEELEELAYRDPLTGLYNRRFGLESLGNAISFAQRYKQELHILLLDLDHFKKVNDELGHPAGDRVLVQLAKLLHKALRESDTIARIGGEEFLVILPVSRAELVHGAANRIRDITARTTFEPVPWRVTVSIGVTGLREHETPESMLSRADRFLYDSKRGGRNRVTGS